MSLLIQWEEPLSAAETCKAPSPFCARKLLINVRKAHSSLSGTCACASGANAADTNTQANTRRADCFMSLVWIITYLLGLLGMHLRNQNSNYRKVNRTQPARMGRDYRVRIFFV